MPRYYFHVQDGIDLPDLTGHECRDLAAAQRMAVRLAGDLIRELGTDLWIDGHWEMNVTDDNQLTLFCLMFTAVNSPAMALHR